jgi:Cys-tRNA(Pro)/Cys-tRNA(Cys) deacylase
VAHKTNAVRLLDQFRMHYELRDYEVDPENLDAATVAAKIGLPPQQVFKTLVARGDRNGICMAVIPGVAELDLKALAEASGDRNIQLIPVNELRGFDRRGYSFSG